MRALFTNTAHSLWHTILLAICAIIFMVLDHNHKLTGVRKVFSLPFATVHTIISWPNTAFLYIKANFETYDDLRLENFRLKTESLLLRARLQRLLA